MDRFVIRLKSKRNEKDLEDGISTSSASSATEVQSSSTSSEAQASSRSSEAQASSGSTSSEVQSSLGGAENTGNAPEEEDDQVRKKRKYYTISVSKISEEFKWIDSSKDFLFCKICNVKLNGSRFHMKRHENNLNHKKGAMAVKSSQKLDTLVCDNKETQRLSDSIKTAEIKLCCFICQENLPLLLTDKLPIFNTEIYPDSKIAKGVSMKRKKATQIITGILGPTFKKEVIIELKVSKFSIIIDETTDISIKKSLVLVARYWSESNQRVIDRFMDLVEVEICTSEAIFSVLKKFLDENNIPYINIIGFASDNASVMMGAIKGVQARMKEIAPQIYVQGCSSHSLHLCSSAAASKLPNTVEQFVRDIYSYFSHSSKRIYELRECQIFAEEKPHKLLYPSQTRWLSLKAVVDRILEHWNSLRLFFQRAALEDNLPNAKSILNALENDIFKVYLLHLSFTLEHINKINVEFQSETPKVPVLLSRMTALYKTFLRSFIKRNILETKNFLDININDPAMYKSLDEMYFGAKLDAFLMTDNLKCSNEDIHNFRLRALEYYIEFCTQVKKRFDFKDKYLELASYFAPSVAKSGNILSIANFVNLFPDIAIDIESANTEWQLLPEMVQLNENMDLNSFWKTVDNIKNNNNVNMFPTLMKIARVILALPHSSATAERVFSQLALIKTFLRNRLLITTVAAILHIKDKMKYVKNDAIGFQPTISLLNYNSIMLETTEVE